MTVSLRGEGLSPLKHLFIIQNIRKLVGDLDYQPDDGKCFYYVIYTVYLLSFDDYIVARKYVLVNRKGEINLKFYTEKTKFLIKAPENPGPFPCGGDYDTGAN